MTSSSTRNNSDAANPAETRPVLSQDAQSLRVRMQPQSRKTVRLAKPRATIRGEGKETAQTSAGSPSLQDSQVAQLPLRAHCASQD